jgi:hypothetical protein
MFLHNLLACLFNTCATPLAIAIFPEAAFLHTNAISTVPFGPGPTSHIKVSSTSRAVGKDNRKSGYILVTYHLV